MTEEINKVPNEEISDTEIVSETPVKDEATETAKPHPAILVTMTRPDGPRETPEGMRIVLPENSKIIPEVCESMFVTANASTLDDGRTTLVTARLRNNFVMSATHTVLSQEDYDVNQGTQIALGKIRAELWKHMEFLLACATYTPEQLQKEYTEVDMKRPANQETSEK